MREGGDTADGERLVTITVEHGVTEMQPSWPELDWVADALPCSSSFGAIPRV